MDKKLISSNSPLEPQIGFSRAVRNGTMEYWKNGVME